LHYLSIDLLALPSISVHLRLNSQVRRSPQFLAPKFGTIIIINKTQLAAHSMSILQSAKSLTYRYRRAPTDVEQSKFNDLEAPDGGQAAWLQVLGGFFIWMNTLQVTSYTAHYSYSDPS
jgi:hypothetical protein